MSRLDCRTIFIPQVVRYALRWTSPVRLPLLLIVLLCAMPTEAGVPGANGFPCKNAGNQQEMNVCASKGYRDADKQLNRSYRKMIGVVSPAKQDSLRREQRRWLASRDSTCKAEVQDFEGGSIWPLEYFSCLRVATERRTKEINAWGLKQ